MLDKSFLSLSETGNNIEVFAELRNRDRIQRYFTKHDSPSRQVFFSALLTSWGCKWQSSPIHCQHLRLHTTPERYFGPCKNFPTGSFRAKTIYKTYMRNNHIQTFVETKTVDYQCRYSHDFISLIHCKIILINY